MIFRDTLDRHFLAIRERDLPALIETFPTDELTLITSDRRLVRDVREFIAMHRGWFAASTWNLDAEPINVVETPQMGLALISLTYRDHPPDRQVIEVASHLSLVFAFRDGRWLMIRDQNTPSRSESTGAT